MDWLEYISEALEKLWSAEDYEQAAERFIDSLPATVETKNAVLYYVFHSHTEDALLYENVAFKFYNLLTESEKNELRKRYKKFTGRYPLYLRDD